MTVLTKTAMEVFAPTTAGGAPRGASMGEAQTWGTEIEQGVDGAAGWLEEVGETPRPPYAPPSGGTSVGSMFRYILAKAALRIGGNDATPTNDEKNYWRGLPSANAWGDPANIGLYSTAFNRNGASYGTYSNTFGHDCVAYGTASVAGGAGSCTGDPDSPSTPFTGYCSFSWGKNVLAMGEKSVALGEEGQARGRASFVVGYLPKAGPAIISQPGGLVSDGIGSAAVGYQTEAYGDGAFAVGQWVRSYSNSKTIGSGINPGSPMVNDVSNSVGIGANAVKPVLTAMPGSGTTADMGYVRLRGKVQFVEPTDDSVTYGEMATIITNSGSGVTAAIQFSARQSGSLLGVATVHGSLDGSRSFAPAVANSSVLGGASARWYQAFFAVAADVSSDERLKEDVGGIPSEWVRAAKSVKPQRYRLKADGPDAKWRIGYIAQDIIAAFDAEGCDVFETNIISVGADGMFGVNYTEFEALRGLSCR